MIEKIPATSERNTEGKERAFFVPNWGMLFGMFVTISTVLLWTAGYCYTAGYWGAARLPQSFINRSFQEILIYGTVPEWNWLGLIIMSGGYCVLFLVFSFRIELPGSLKKAERALPKRSRFSIDPEAIRISFAFGVICALTLICIFVMRVWWMPNAWQEGRAQFLSDLCDEKIRTESKEPAPATISLGADDVIRGRILHHAEKYVVLLDEKAVYIVSNAENLRLLGKIAAPSLDCKAQFPEKYKLKGKEQDVALAGAEKARKTRASWAMFLAMIAICAFSCAVSCWARVYSLNAHNFRLPEGKASERSRRIFQFAQTVIVQNDLNRYAAISMCVALAGTIFSAILLS
ncbi:hypothetical protein [Herbaspirillum robiniae]|jgi:hypothetical protein|uniref:hypothetical protein n=1 Tax=Herbaspirillum robiniae TaxID=2014887 RepID=UPI00101AD48E|nr:hypothetical protein [Herbaspirillum robiniae]